MRRLILPHLLALFPTYGSVRGAVQRAVARVSVSVVLFANPSLVAPFAARTLLSAKAHSDVRLLVSRLTDSLR